MNHRSKIHNLPRHIRNELNRRIDDGEQANHLVDWLNSLDETKAILAKYFSGRPINDQNLCDWRYSGFRDWARREQTLERIDRFLECTFGINDPSSSQRDVGAHLSSFLAAELAADILQTLSETSDRADRANCITAAIRNLTALRNGDTAFARSARQAMDWETKEQAASKADVEAASGKMVHEAALEAASPIWDHRYCESLTKTLGPGPNARAAAEVLINIKRAARGYSPLFKPTITPASAGTPTPTNAPASASTPTSPTPPGPNPAAPAPESTAANPTPLTSEPNPATPAPNPFPFEPDLPPQPQNPPPFDYEPINRNQG